MMTDLSAAAGNHLWQSTIFALLAGAAALALRGVPARSRYWLWFAASLKFLVPFSLLISTGTGLAPKRSNYAELQPPPYYEFDAVSQPFTFTPQALANSVRNARIRPSRLSDQKILMAASFVWAAGFMAVLGSWILRWRQVAAALRNAAPAVDGVELSALRKLEAEAKITRPIPLWISGTTLEPGIFGIWRSALVWPRGISERLTEVQIEAIIAHEFAHVRRRDNLTATVHLVVEAIFWFHPIVWWLHARLVAEREYACDEAVVILGSEPEVYAEGILRACQFSIESPLACVSGISGSDLKQRVCRIVADQPVRGLTRRCRIFFAGLALATLLVPILFGFLDAPRVRAGLLYESDAKARYSFEVATVKPSNREGQSPRSLMMMPGKFSAQNFPLRDLIMFAYNAKSTSQISGYPDWVASNQYDINAKEDESTAAALDKLPREERSQQVRLMVQSLLEERFHLKVSRKMKEIPVYALVVAKGGPNLKEAAGPPPSNSDSMPGVLRRMGIFMKGSGELEGNSASLDFLADGVLSRMPEIGDRVVVNKTGLTGNYDFKLKWTPETVAVPPGGAGDGVVGAQPADNSAPGLFTALQEQLGLKLESEKGSVETLIVDSIDKPTPN
jgi:bla regulator protein BlaR1